MAFIAATPFFDWSCSIFELSASSVVDAARRRDCRVGVGVVDVAFFLGMVIVVVVVAKKWGSGYWIWIWKAIAVQNQSAEGVAAFGWKFDVYMHTYT